MSMLKFAAKKDSKLSRATTRRPWKQNLKDASISKTDIGNAVGTVLGLSLGAYAYRNRANLAKLFKRAIK